MHNPVFELTVLGSGTCAATVERSMSGYHVNISGTPGRFLLDIGAGSLRRLLEAGEDYRDIDAIFISHLHTDHVADLVPFLWATLHTPAYNRTKVLQIFGPPGMNAWYANLAQAYGEWLYETNFGVEIIEKENESWRWNELDVTSAALQHSTPVNGYAFQKDGRLFVYSGDTGPCSALINLAKNADLLLCECSFPASRKGIDFHLNSETAGEVAKAADVKKLVLTHMYPECEAVDIRSECAKIFPGNIELARDLMRLTI
ncbi:MAG: MBL fold metallo-hydrolase [Calditrichaeota bacterium]|nr:MAG: MBL fold metallo-hydrolase [Calditrichota bacterium]